MTCSSALGIARLAPPLPPAAAASTMEHAAHTPPEAPYSLPAREEETSAPPSSSTAALDEAAAPVSVPGVGADAAMASPGGEELEWNDALFLDFDDGSGSGYARDSLDIGSTGFTGGSTAPLFFKTSSDSEITARLKGILKPFKI